MRNSPGISKTSVKVPSSLVVLGTNISSPAIKELTSDVSSLGPPVELLQKLFLALMILSLINSATAIILSFLGILFRHNRKILYANVSLATLGFFTRGIDALLATTLGVIIVLITNKFGQSAGISANVGVIFIVLIWLGFVCQVFASSYWFCVWFVEFRQVSFRIRKREIGEIGDYKGILREVKSDVRSPKEVNGQEKASTTV